jgi:hypothetical protein
MFLCFTEQTKKNKIKLKQKNNNNFNLLLKIKLVKIDNLFQLLYNKTKIKFKYNYVLYIVDR